MAIKRALLWLAAVALLLVSGTSIASWSVVGTSSSDTVAYSPNVTLGDFTVFYWYVTSSGQSGATFNTMQPIIGTASPGGGQSFFLTRIYPTGGPSNAITICEQTNGGAVDCSNSVDCRNAGTVCNVTPTWANYALRRTGSSIHYFSGGFDAGSYTYNSTGIAWTIFQPEHGDSGSFNGQFARIGVWNVALSNNEINALAHCAPVPSVRANHLVFYAPAYGYLTTDRDYSGRAAAGTLTSTGTLKRMGDPPCGPDIPVN